MRILQVGKFYTPFRGGIETVVQNLSEELVKNGHEVTALVSSHHFLPRIEWIGGVRVVRMGRWGTLCSQPINPFCLFYFLFFAWKSDVVHIHSPNPLLEICSFFIRKKKVVTFHAEVVRQRAFLPFYRLLQKAFFHSVECVIVGSKSLAKKISERQKVAIIPFGISQKRFDDQRVASLKVRYGSFALFVGRLVSYKGIPVLLESMRELSEKGISLNLVLVGAGPEEENWKKLVASYGLEKRVFFLKEIPESELGDFYAACEIFVLPSITQAEAFGMVLVEAMSFGKPIISTKLGTGVDEVNEDQKTGIQILPSDSVALRSAIEFLILHPEKREQFGNYGKEKFKNIYSAEQMVKSYLTVYERLVHA